MIYGYARVSTGGQSEATQVRQLRAAGAGRVFREVASGAKTDLPQLRRLLAEIGAGDVLMVTRLDRLRARPETFSTPSRRSPVRKAGFGPLPTRGPTRRRRTGA
jgi:DNA invertase Pin-like site-specific DNA recombinase